ncbi:MAG TPA: tRNA (adenosine(37)-N6)-threonylcarbamoyltransferase complex transferase subunit TsaD [Spirochaetales bacterium]|nr:tRNA (adenosine(37)-N6)-threonylcarbamoyltransferase complex transferase subunit TsaD [Spirochaetales bacterium]
MVVLGIETSCDECALAVLQEGKKVLGSIVASQLDIHRPYYGVVPEIASRVHLKWILPVYREVLKKAGIQPEDLEGIAATNRPGLLGALLVGFTFGKALAYSLGISFVAVDHVRAHLYAPHIEKEIQYPYIGLLVSGGHTLLAIVRDFNNLEVVGTTIDDACGEAFDKVAKFYNFGYPGGVAIDRLAQEGDPRAFSFPDPSLHKGKHRYDISYSRLKTAVINQLEQFRNPGYEPTPENIAASFQKCAIDFLLKRLFAVVEDFGIHRIVVGGGVAANSYLRKVLSENSHLEVLFPSMELCTDNAIMVAGLGTELLKRGVCTPYSENAFARVPAFKVGGHR